MELNFWLANYKKTVVAAAVVVVIIVYRKRLTVFD